MIAQNKFARVDLRYLFLLSLFIFIVGVFSTLFIYKNVKNQTEQSILTRTNTIAQFIDLDKLKNLSGDETDLSNVDYLYLKNIFQNAVKYNTDARFIYLMGKRDDNIFFILDSEPDDSPDYSPPGQIYTEANPDIFYVFSSKKGMVEDIYEDRWGKWLTALTPIIDPVTGNVLAIVGMDINASQFTKTLLIYSSIPFIVTILILIFILIYYFFHKKETERMLLKSELVSLASHEIRSPLNGIRWSLETLIKNEAAGLKGVKSKGYETLVLIKEACDQILLTVNDLLDLSLVEKQKSKDLSWSDVDIITLLREIVKNSQLSILEKSIDIVLDSSISGPVHVFGDREKLKRMFINLISNAVKYSKKDSTVTIGCQPEDSDCVFWIKDSGIGIPESEQQKVLNGFYRANNARASTELGTGLGLYYVLEVVKLHKGKIWFKSKENVGTTFFIKLTKKRDRA